MTMDTNALDRWLEREEEATLAAEIPSPVASCALCCAPIYEDQTILAAGTPTGDAFFCSEACLREAADNAALTASGYDDVPDPDATPF